MQPLTAAEEAKAAVSDTGDNATAPGASAGAAKRRAPVKRTRRKKKKKDEPVETVEPGAAAALVSETRRPGSYRGKCLYQSRKCENERAVKRNGKPHNLCEEHRSKQNQHQRKFDAKKFSRKRRRGSVSDDDNDELPSLRSGEPSAKHHRAVATQQEAETRTPTHVVAATDEHPLTPMVPAVRGAYYYQYTAGSTPMSAPLTRLLPIQSPRGPILPPSPAVVYAHPQGAGRPGVVGSEAYPRGHVVSAGYRPGAGQMVPSGQHSPHVSHRPYLQQQGSQPPAGYSHSELVAARTLVQPQQSPSPAAVTTPVYYRNGLHAAGTPRENRGQAVTTPRVLPSLLVPPSAALLPSPFHRVSGAVPSSVQRFTPVVVTPSSSVSVSPARSAGNLLPPLVPFALRRSPTSTQSVLKPPNK
ncbi:hypothetical protein PHYPSEUDO_004279 [Phytophthora pseudosyringae]|uniref:Uncharacterized protein n=1 Tax=Phytophthora pseudosyringae TaxID=221518 RepID=A0A8T1VSD5_9STRA|nr:hypothetical protein PHYPSEUDO_004279 [Phytophthora pseudosyringae]